MNSFGLGLALNFTDNASSGMRAATQTFNQMSSIINQLEDDSSRTATAIQSLAMAGQGLTTVGSQISSIGMSISSVFAGLITNVNNTGSTLLNARSQLELLYGSAEKGEDVLKNIKSYAASSIFNFEDLLPTVVMLKANGIEAFDKIASSTGKANQTLMDYAADLAAFNPQMRNAYGTGIQAAMGAINEYIAEGNAKSLKSGASLDITALLGEAKGSTIEERSRQIADLLEQLNMVGMTSSLAGTATQRLSNAEDILFDVMTRISDAGVFDKYTELVAKFTDYLFNIPDEELQSIAESIADALVSLMSPLETLIDLALKAADGLRNLIKEHPGLAKMVLTITAFTGVGLVAFGTLLKLSGSIFMLTSGFMQMGTLASQGVTFMNLLSKASGAFITTILPLAALAVLLYEVWTKNIFGIRDTITQAFEEIGNIVALTFDAFTDNTLSIDQFKKAEELGILPFIEAILQLKYHFGILVDGFKQGFSSIFEWVNKVAPVITPVKGFFYDLADKVGGFISKFTGIDASSGWEKFGQILGKVAGVITTLLPVIKAVKIAIGAFSGPIGIIIAVISLLGIAWKKNLFGIQDKMKVVIDWFKSLDWEAIWGKISTVFETVWNNVVDFAKKAWVWLQPIFEAIAELAMKVFEVLTSEEFKSMMADIGKVVGDVFTTIFDVIKDLAPLLGPVVDFIQTVIVSVVDMITTYVIPYFQKIMPRVVDFVTTVVSWVTKLVQFIRPAIQKLVGWVQKIWDGWLKDLVQNVIAFVGKVIEFFGAFFTWLYDNAIKPLVTIISWLLEVLQPVIEGVVNHIVDIVMVVVDWLGGIINSIVEMFSGIIDFFTGIFTGDWEKVWQGVCEIFKGVWDGIVSVFKGIVNALITVVNGIIGGLNLLKVPDWVPGIGGFGINIPEIPYLSTGGEIKGEGVSYLHPNEVVVNSETTDGLRDFIRDYKNDKAIPAVENPEKGVAPVYEYQSDNSSTLNNYTNTQNNTTNTSASTQQSKEVTNIDNSITFSEGSIVIQVASTSDSDLEKTADKLMKIIERKKQLKKMAVRPKEQKVYN